MTKMNYEVYRNSPGMWNRFFRKERETLFDFINQNEFEKAYSLQNFLRTEIARNLLKEISSQKDKLPLSTIKIIKNSIIFIENL